VEKVAVACCKALSLNFLERLRYENPHIGKKSAGKGSSPEFSEYN
jgi:hypothetical protein